MREEEVEELKRSIQSEAEAQRRNILRMTLPKQISL